MSSVNNAQQDNTTNLPKNSALVAGVPTLDAPNVILTVVDVYLVDSLTLSILLQVDVSPVVALIKVYAAPANTQAAQVVLDAIISLNSGASRVSNVFLSD